IALALISRIRMVAKGHDGLKHKGAREIIEAMESVVRITFEGKRNSLVTETSPLQRNIIETFGLKIEP
ncbi:MAG: hypothetical protein FWG02_08155, partial [Holophagaceae bacterium]|nr:hypothetical protein [Holophagaceae bacterium]